MEKDPDQQDLNPFDPSKEMDFLKELNLNKEVMLKILENSPRVGVYKNQEREDWEGFFQFFMNFLKSQIGPRGECAKKVRKQLLKEEDKVNKLLAPFNLKATNHIREIYMKIKNYVPCDEYTQLKRLEESRQKNIENIKRFQDGNSELVKAISVGLIKKHGKDFDVSKELSMLKDNYVKKLEQGDEMIKYLKEFLDKKQEYHYLISAQSYLQPYFKEWKTADSELGRQNCKTGQAFQVTVSQKILPYLIYKQEQTKNWYFEKYQIQVFTNVSWIPKSLGQIDIALGFKDQKQNRYFITTLIECKSRFFDLREAYKQVSLQDQKDLNKGPTFQELKFQKKMRIKIQQQKQLAKINEKKSKNHAEKTIQGIQKKFYEKTTEIKEKQQLEEKKEQSENKIEENGDITKKFLSTKYGPAQLVPNHHFFIITTLPHNDFVLPIESKMKQGIDKFTKNMFVEDIQSEPLFKALQERFEGVLSPLDWFKQYESQWKDKEFNIFVMK